MRKRRFRGVVAALGTGLVAAVVATAGSPALAALGSWSVIPAPNPTVQFTYLQSVSAVTDNEAWAVGYVQPPTAGAFQPLALRWDGTAWSTTNVPTLSTRGTTLYAVSAVSGDAWAVGSFFVPAGYRVVQKPVALHWTAVAGWTSVTAPGGGTWFGVSDLGPGDAWAIGAEGVKHWSHNAWSDVATPSPGTSAGPGSLIAISARTSTDIWAVGSYPVTRHISASFAVHYDGTRWTTSQMPMATATQLSSILAVGSNDVWAVGQINSGTFAQPVTEHWDGQQWSIVSSPSLDHGGYLRGVTTRGSGEVWAAGLAFGADAGVTGTLTLRLNNDGKRWSTVQSPPDEPAILTSVSTRPGTNRVWAVGSTNAGAPLIIERH